jgi:hypothetical protein
MELFGRLGIVRDFDVPLGGTQRHATICVTIFTHLALWYDLIPRLLGCGRLTTLSILPEVVPKNRSWYVPRFALRKFSRGLAILIRL